MKAPTIKESGDGLAIQVTKQARRAGMVDEDAEGDATRLAGVYVYGFDGILLIVDAENVSDSDRAELVSSAASDTGSVYRGEASSMAIAGNGYQVQLPGCHAAGFSQGDQTPVRTEPGLMVVHDGENERIAGDLITLRADQRSG
jgi:hypothetical protein